MGGGGGGGGLYGSGGGRQGISVGDFYFSGFFVSGRRVVVGGGRGEGVNEDMCFVVKFLGEGGGARQFFFFWGSGNIILNTLCGGYC